MKIIAHRGLWKSEDKKNSLDSLVMAIKSNFGIETDLRNHNDKIYVCHDIIDVDKNITFPQLIDSIKDINNFSNNLIFLNIKSDGIISMVVDYLRKEKIDNYVLFDMSLPELWKSRNYYDNVFAGISDIFNIDYKIKNFRGFWVDSFIDEQWITNEQIKKWLEDDYQLCIVSPELHRRDYLNFWKKIKSFDCINDKRIMICTDKPNEALEFFKEVINE